MILLGAARVENHRDNKKQGVVLFISLKQNVEAPWPHLGLSLANSLPLMLSVYASYHHIHASFGGTSVFM